ncbi:MAG: heparan-alpha-glucosaminide N-acetyltransferase domain-containing protein [Bacteroidota bacterium]
MMAQPISPDLTNTGTGLTKYRVTSIDLLRGIVMIIMSLDHVRDYFHLTANIDDPLNLATTTPGLYFTRWITHYCAPIFVFLSGTSAYMQRSRKTTKELSLFLLKRGLWLIFAEFIIIALAWTFNPTYSFIPMQVIWTIGISMVILAGAVWLPFNLILALGLLIVFGHNLLDITEAAPGFKPGFFFDLFHSGHFAGYNLFANHYAVIVYPFMPWTGVMLVGYCAGKFFSRDVDAGRRKKILIGLGLSLLAFFVILRYSNVYGNPSDWSTQKSSFYMLLSFLRVEKYPPSLLYLCMTLGPALLFLAFFDNIKNRVTDFCSVFGRTAFFYYILHLYLIHLLASITFFLRGHSFAEGTAAAGGFPFLFVLPGEGFGLPGVFGVWLLVNLLLYPMCKWYDGYKTRHKEKWWLSYL